MSSSAAYKQNVIGGKLKLKRPLNAANSTTTTTTQRITRPPSTSSPTARSTTSSPPQRAAPSSDDRREAEKDEGGSKDDAQAAGSGEKRQKTQTEAEVIRKKISKSHRQAIEEYNAKLASLSEHNDIPRVGPG